MPPLALPLLEARELCIVAAEISTSFCFSSPIAISWSIDSPFSASKPINKAACSCFDFDAGLCISFSADISAADIRELSSTRRRLPEVKETLLVG
jgi:hypothetical protein